jgi:uncharacterized protein with NRDE domain
MCLIIFAHQQHASYPLLVAANRDEYYQRPTREAHIWPGSERLLAGKDLTAGGTWLGITAGGRFAAITNHRNPAQIPAQPRSRGLLTLDFLRGHMTPLNYLQDLSHSGGEYAGFNLLLGDGAELCYYSNVEGVPQQLKPGVYGLSNALLDTPWPKLDKGRNQMRELVSDSRLTADEQGHASLARVVTDRTPNPEHRFEDQNLDPELALLLSAQFICSDEYGTRATTSLLLRSDGNISFGEQNFGAGGNAAGSAFFTLNPDEGEKTRAGHNPAGSALDTR